MDRQKSFQLLGFEPVKRGSGVSCRVMSLDSVSLLSRKLLSSASLAGVKESSNPVSMGLASKLQAAGGGGPTPSAPPMQGGGFTQGGPGNFNAGEPACMQHGNKAPLLDDTASVQC